MASFNEIVSAINSGRAVVKPLPYDPNEEGRMYADYGVYIDGKLVPNTNDRTVLPVNFKQVLDPATNEYVNDYTQPQEIRLRERTGGSQFKDVNMAFDPKTNTVTPPTAKQFYNSGSKDSGFNIGGFISDIGSLASSASPVLTAIAGAYFGPMVAETIGGAGAIPPESPFLSGMAAENAVSGAGVAGTGLSSGIAPEVAKAVNPATTGTSINAVSPTNVVTPTAGTPINAVSPTTAPSYTAPSAGSVAADNIDVGGGFNPATGTGDAATRAAAAATGVTPSASVPYGSTSTPTAPVNFTNPAAVAAGTGLSSLLTPTNVLLGKGILDTLGSNKVVGGINSAAATQQAAYEKSITDLAGLYSNQQAYQRPYMATGLNNLSTLGSLGTGQYQMYDASGAPTTMGTGSGYLQHQFDATDLAKGLAPNYDFMLQQGQMANQRAANMAGGGFGGNALQGLNKYTQDYAGTAYQNAFKNYQDQRQNIFGNLKDLVNVGQGATNQLTTATGNYGTNLTNLNVGNAAAQAAAQVAAAQQGGTNLSNLGNTAVVASLLNQKPAVAQTPVA